MHRGTLVALVGCVFAFFGAVCAQAGMPVPVAGAATQQHERNLPSGAAIRPVAGREILGKELQLVQSPPFGTPQVVFVAGIWRIAHLITRFQDGSDSRDFFFWADNGDKAVQVTLESNGWWGLRRRSIEDVVQSSGNFDRQNDSSFYQRPWLTAGHATFPIFTATYEGASGVGRTFIQISGDQIVITLTDGGQLRLDTRGRDIVFRTRFGTTFTF